VTLQILKGFLLTLKIKSGKIPAHGRGDAHLSGHSDAKVLPCDPCYPDKIGGFTYKNEVTFGLSV
jgi:hypothetical protein